MRLFCKNGSPLQAFEVKQKANTSMVSVEETVYSRFAGRYYSSGRRNIWL